MGRATVLCWEAAVVAGLLCGCGTTPKGSWFAREADPPEKQEVASSSTSEKAKEAPAKPAEKPKPTPITPAVAVPAAKVEPIAVVQHDAETLKLIDYELRDATPEEREQWYNDLKRLDQHWVRKILRTRRLTMNRLQPGGPNPQPQPNLEFTAYSQNSGLAGVPPQGTVGPSMSGPWNGQYAGNTATAPNQFSNGPSYSPAMGRSPSPQFGHNPNQVAGPSGGLGNHQPWPARQSAQADGSLMGPHHTAYPPGYAAGGAPPSAQPPANPFADTSFSAHAHGVQTVGAQGAQPNQPNQVQVAAPTNGGVLPTPSMNGGPLGWAGELQQLISQAEAELANAAPGMTEVEQHEYIRKHVNLRWLYLISGQRARAMEAIPDVPRGDQEFWQQMFWSVSNYFDAEALPDGTERATQTVEQLRAAVEKLQPHANLELCNVNFCHKITSFGNYERFPRDEFSPGQPVLVYAEVNNFQSDPAPDGRFRTRLRSTIEIYKAGPDGGLVDREEFSATEDYCRNHRRDYFHSYQIDIPQSATLGPHVMKLIVEDQLSQKVATYSLNFTVK